MHLNPFDLNFPKHCTYVLLRIQHAIIGINFHSSIENKFRSKWFIRSSSNPLLILFARSHDINNSMSAEKQLSVLRFCVWNLLFLVSMTALCSANHFLFLDLLRSRWNNYFISRALFMCSYARINLFTCIGNAIWKIAPHWLIEKRMNLKKVSALWTIQHLYCLHSAKPFRLHFTLHPSALTSIPFFWFSHSFPSHSKTIRTTNDAQCSFK